MLPERFRFIGVVSDIDSYFDIDGMIIVRDEDEIIKACNALTPELYVQKDGGYKSKL